MLGVAVAAQVGVSVIDQGLPTLTWFIKADLGLSAAAAGLTVSSFALGKIFGAYVRLRGERASLDEQPANSVRVGRLGDRNLVLLMIWGCLVVTSQYALLAFFALDLHQRIGLSLERGSLLVAAANASGIAGRVAWGAVSDRALGNGRKPLLLVLTAACLVGSLALLAAPRSTSTIAMTGLALLAVLTLIGYQGLWVTMAAETAGPERVGAATGLAITFVTIAIALSPPLYGLVADLAGSYRAIWAALSTA